MASSSTSSTMKSSSSEEDLNQMMNERKRKRMASNRESARRSRLRKQKLVDDLTAEINQLTTGNDRILSAVKITTENYTNIESENSVLRATMEELKNRLQSLEEIIDFVNPCQGYEGCGYTDQMIGGYNDDASVMMNQLIVAEMIMR